MYIKAWNLVVCLPFARNANWKSVVSKKLQGLHDYWLKSIKINKFPKVCQNSEYIYKDKCFSGPVVPLPGL